MTIKDHRNASTTLTLSPTESQCINEVFNFISSLIPNAQNNIDPLQIVHIERLKSAQQYVLLLTVKLQYTLSETEKLVETNIAAVENVDDNCSNCSLKSLKRAIDLGNGKLILRIWKNGARWWNLNLKSFFHLDSDEKIDRETNEYINDSSILCHDLAKAEVGGYRVAKLAFEYYNMLCRQRKTNYVETNICIPTLIHFQENKLHRDSSSPNNYNYGQPWALFTYVGEDSDFLVSVSKSRKEEWVICKDFIHNMVKIRHEFGFDEAHNRHGRVNVNQALDYAMHVMDTIIVPLHSAFFDCYFNKKEKEKWSGDLLSPTDGSQHPLLQQHKSDLSLINYFILQQDNNTEDTRKKFSSESKVCRYDDMVNMYFVIISHLKRKIIFPSQNERNKVDLFSKFLKILDKCVMSLQEESKTLDNDGVEYLPGVLCHLDLQPQNMILCRDRNSNDKDRMPTIFSALDWEESCYADPRFELLLLCRKVVANRKQADSLWKRYEETIQIRFGHKLNRNVKSILGSIEPWLKLETVHSLITLFMQGMDLGGRSPMECDTQSSLLDKMLREIKRLIDLGWEFCNEVLDS